MFVFTVKIQDVHTVKTLFSLQLLEVSKSRINDHQARMTKVKNSLLDAHITVGR